MDIYPILTACPLFRGLSEQRIWELLEAGGQPNYIITEYQEGDYIARRDMAYSGLMIILRGRVHGEITYVSGQSQGINMIEAPQLIAPAFLFGGYNRLPIDVIADEKVVIMTIHRGYVFELMQSNTLILSNFIDIISNRANIWSKKIYFLSFRSLKEKVATYLLEHSSERNEFVPVPDIVEIAESFEATRSAVLSVLSDMEKKKLILLQDEHIHILNRQGLYDIVK